MSESKENPWVKLANLWGLLIGLSPVFLTRHLIADELPPQTAELVLTHALVIESLGKSGRDTLFTDALESRVAAGDWRPPALGEIVESPNGRTHVWTNAVADGEGWLSGPGFRGGWAYWAIEVSAPRILLLNASGQTMTYVNGEPRVGDIYQYGNVEVPVMLRSGRNDFLFATGRGRLRARLHTPAAAVAFLRTDDTTPDLRTGEMVDTWAAVVLINSTPRWTDHLVLEAECLGQSTRTPVPPMPPLGIRKVGFCLVGPPPSPGSGESVSVTLRLVSSGAENSALDTQVLSLRVRQPEQIYKRTFVSEIDDSIQYFAVNPGVNLPRDAAPALYLSFHGASVQALGQAEAYAPKPSGHIVSPTNRRPYAFDWEDWGRLDALEVLERASVELRPDTSRIYLTGHSMGGHGTWNFGATFPDRFAAIGPSAGWISFFSYANANSFSNASPVESILRRSAASSDTLALATNYLHHGVYIVHGDADDNVPVTEARRMREVLGSFHRDFDWHEEAGAGHWWDRSDEPGADCVDWAPMFDFFARHRIPSDRDLRRIRFLTVNPGVSSRSHWMEIDAQEKPLTPSEVEVQWDPGQHRLIATTHNVSRMTFNAEAVDPSGHGMVIEADGQKLTNIQALAVSAPATPEFIPGVPRVWRRALQLEKTGGQWTTTRHWSAGEKNPRRNGPFKEAFRHHMRFVYGTHGTAVENAWALAKARFDSEAFWYRGNASVEIEPDVRFDPALHPDQGVILYGHRDMNSAWFKLLDRSPVQVYRGEVKVGGRSILRGDLACLFLQPRPDSDLACVGVVAGTGEVGLRLTYRLPYFMAGPGFPDCLILEPDFLRHGTGGIVTAGFFGIDWSVDQGDFAWKW